MTPTVTIADHERVAMQQLVLNARGFASMLKPGDSHEVRLLIWAQALEDVLTRMETAGSTDK